MLTVNCNLMTEEYLSQFLPKYKWMLLLDNSFNFFFSICERFIREVIRDDCRFIYNHSLHCFVRCETICFLFFSSGCNCKRFVKCCFDNSQLFRSVLHTSICEKYPNFISVFFFEQSFEMKVLLVVKEWVMKNLKEATINDNSLFYMKFFEFRIRSNTFISSLSIIGTDW